MSFEIAIDSRLPPEAQRLAQSTGPIIEEVVQPDLDDIRAEWEGVPDRPNQLNLKLRYDFIKGYREEVFNVSELHSPEQFRSKLGEMWWALLQDSSRRSQKRVRELLRNLDEE